MSTRIKFDVYEAAILHDACLRYEKGKLTRQQAIKEVSLTLRSRAQASGLRIDSSFRNEAGISFQLGVMQNVVTGGKLGVAQRSRLFESIASMYETERAKYNQILTTALAFNKTSDGEITGERTRVNTVTMTSDPFLDYLNDIGIVYIDKRSKGGCLWLIGGRQLDYIAKDAKKQGILLRYSPNGGRVTRRRSAWWTSQKTDKYVRKDVPRVLHDTKPTVPIKSDVADTRPPSESNTSGRTGSGNGGVERSNTIIGFRQWMTDEGLAESSARSYSSAIKNVEQFLRDHGRTSFRFYGNDDLTSIKSMVLTLFEDRDFIRYNDQQHNRFRAALRKFVAFVESRNQTLEASTLSRHNETCDMTDEPTRSMVVEVATDGFPNGIRPDSIIDRRKIKRLFQERYGSDAPDEKHIHAILVSSGVSWNGKTYLISKEAKRQIKELIDGALATGSRIIYYDALYSATPSFYTDRMVYSPEALKSVMESIGVNLAFFKNYCATGRGVTIEDELLRAFGDDVRLPVDELKRRLPYVPAGKITPSLSISNLFVRVRAGEYACVGKIEIDPQDQVEAEHLVESEIASQGFASLSNVDLTRTLGNNPMLSEAAIRDALFIQTLANRYDKKGQIVTAKGSAISANDIMRRHCRKIDEATLNELDEFEEAITGQARNAILPIAFETMVRIDRDVFVGEGRVMFDSKAIDDALAFFVGDEICPIKAITSFNSFPYAGQPWTLYLLESYLARFSKVYSIMGGPARTDNVGAIYPRDMDFADYGDLIARVLADSHVDLQGEAAAQYLISTGFVLRKTAFVRTAIERARTLREIKG